LESALPRLHGQDQVGLAIRSGEVFRDLHRLKKTKALSFGERRMLDTARGLVSQELSAARSVDRATVEKELESVLNEGQA